MPFVSFGSSNWGCSKVCLVVGHCASDSLSCLYKNMSLTFTNDNVRTCCEIGRDNAIETNNFRTITIQMLLLDLVVHTLAWLQSQSYSSSFSCHFTLWIGSMIRSKQHVMRVQWAYESPKLLPVPLAGTGSIQIPPFHSIQRYWTCWNTSSTCTTRIASSCEMTTGEGRFL